MTENEFLLADRLQKIKSTIEKYGEENFYISFSGGKDSTVVSALVDIAIPENKIPRVYANTGIEYRMIQDFVYKQKEKHHTWELVVLKPGVNIRETLEKYGYPYKSKEHAKWVDMFQRNGRTQSIENYTHSEKRDKDLYRTCPKKLMHQFDDDYQLRVSDKCCFYIKERPLDQYSKDNKKPYRIVGIMKADEGRRLHVECMNFKQGKFIAFHPLAPVTKEWEDWFIKAYEVDICDIYKEPYNFIRTGCKGCPFALHLQDELDVLEEFFPEERKQCEILWKPVYDEYIRIGYRLKEPYHHQMTIDELLKEEDNGACKRQ